MSGSVIFLACPLDLPDMFLQVKEQGNTRILLTDSGNQIEVSFLLFFFLLFFFWTAFGHLQLNASSSFPIVQIRLHNPVH